jgi:hypothetical protein
MTNIDRRLELSVLPELFAVARLAPDAPVPSWATRGAFFSVTRTSEELSIVTAESNVPTGVRSQANWRALRVHGPFAFSEIGVVSALAAPLADARISLLVVSTFDTDYLLVDSGQLRAAIVTLEGAGHKVHGA